MNAFKKLLLKYKISKTLIAIIILTLISFIIRLYNQPQIPYGFHRDEAGIAYSAYSILKTGKDEWGTTLPLHFKALGDYPPGIYNYLVSGSIFIFGLTEFAERFPAILIGALMIPISYIFIKKYFLDKKLALITSSLLVFTPWDIVQSRAGSEALTGLFFSLIGFILYKYWVNSKKKYHLFLTGIFYFLAIFSYNAIKLGLPLMQIILNYLLWKELDKRQKKISIFFNISLFVLVFFIVFSSSGTSMSFNNTSIFTNSSNTSFEVEFIREGIANVPIFITRIFSNKYVELVKSFIRNYFEYFSFSFLFDDLGFHKRYLVPKVGPLLLFNIPFIILGLIFFRDKFKNKRMYIFLILWILIAPLPAAITATDAPNLKRALFLFFPLTILTTQGIIYTIEYLNQYWHKILFTIFISVALLWNFGFFLKQYAIHTAYETVHHRSYGYKEVYEFTQNNKGDYSNVIFYEGIDTPHTYYLFYTKFPPTTYQQIPENEKRNLFSVNKKEVYLNEYIFRPGKCPDYSEILDNNLYVFNSGCLNETQLLSHVKVLKTVYTPDKLPIFVIVKYNENKELIKESI